MSFKKIDSIFDKYIKDDYFPGGVCYVSQNGEKLFHKAYGKLNRDKNILCELDTVFDIASLTKVVTTTVVLQMVTKNLLSLSTRLGECLPNVSTNEILSPITIKQLLTHSSSLKAWHPFYSHLPGDNLFYILNNIELTHNLTDRVVYSDLNFILLGEVIKNYFNTSLQTIINENLAFPLKLKTLTYNPVNNGNIAATEQGNRIETNMCKEGNFSFNNWRYENISGEVNDGNAFYFFGGESGHAGLFSNVEDLVTLGELYLKGGINLGEELISKVLIQESLKPQIENRGLGWESSDIYPEGFGHTGFTGTALWLDPKRNLVVGLLTNRLHVETPKNINSFRKEVFKEILNKIEKEF
ncbi:serine hydrolase domain-containing protein [Virgibacillus sp. DJP39]|uniref:serine hydrolase domain-containing protein n=1 Tax=Virgibacillus sp. DJP39 TaxID=3409790 RepID=UPI003BB807E2